MMKIKGFMCKRCGYSGIRPEVRKHIREEHRIGIRVDKRLDSIVKHQSEITPQMIVWETE